MKIDEKIIERLSKLIDEGQNLEETLHINRDILEDVVDISLANEWGIKSLNALEDIFADKRFFFDKFSEYYESFVHYGEIKPIRKALGIIKAAKFDYENGYSFKIRTIINAEMFDDFLKQAEELLQKNHFQAAAVITGCVLEDGLRKICHKNSITFPKKTND